MTELDPPDGLRRALVGWAERRQQHAALLAGRGSKPIPGDLYALPCHARVSPTWLVIEEHPDGQVRIAPGDDRPWANSGDLWVGDQELCLRLASSVVLPGDLLPADQRIGVLPEAPREVLEHELATRFVRAPMRDEDEDQKDWRTLVGRVARILPGYLRDGTVELRLSEFAVLGASRPEDGRSQGEWLPGELVAQPRMAAKSSSAQAAFLAAMGHLQDFLLVDELDFDCGGLLHLVASRRGLALLFASKDPDAVPPAVVAKGHEGVRIEWQLGTGVHAAASRIFFPHDWRTGPFSLRLTLRQHLSIRVVDDGWLR